MKFNFNFVKDKLYKFKTTLSNLVFNPKIIESCHQVRYTRGIRVGRYVLTKRKITLIKS